MPPRRTIRDEDWERLRPTIRKLYLEEDRSLKDVLLILGISHSFYPSKAQLGWKLKQWHFTKNMGVMDWKYVGNEIHRRKCRGKESKVYLSGIPLRMKNIERGVSRYCYETAIEKAMRNVPEPPMPEDQPLLVCTPAPQEMDSSCRLDNIPWLVSRRLVEGLALKVPSHMSISYSDTSFEGLVESILFPRFTIQSYTTQLNNTFENLRSIMPEEHEGAHVIRAQGLLLKSRPNTINAEFLFCLVFQLSNNFFPYAWTEEQQERYTATMRFLLRLFRESGSNVFARGQYSMLPPSLQSSLDGLFREAIHASDLGAVELLLRAGVDVNSSFAAPAGCRFKCSTPLQHAAGLNQPELLQMLIDHGADTQKIDIETISSAWLRRKTAKGSPEETMRVLLSIYRFRSEDEIHASQLLFWMSYAAGTPISEAVIEFFRSSFTDSSSAAKAQLLITAIRTNSRFVDDLVAELGHYVNSCGYFPETPMTAAAYKGDIQLCNQLLCLGAAFEPSHKAPTPLQWAASFADVSIVQQLLNWGADVNFFHPSPTLLRVSFEDVSSMRFSCWAPGFRPMEDEQMQDELLGSLGRTALHAALLGGSAATAMCLLNAGATLVGGELVMAIWSGQFEIIGSLRERGASLQDKSTIFGIDTILEAAILSENIDLVYQVIAADERLVSGQALCASVVLAVATSDFTVLRYLLTSKSHLLSSQDTWIGTAMSLAVHLGYMEISEEILKSGLRPETSWHLIMRRNRHAYNALKSLERSSSESTITRGYLCWKRSLQTWKKLLHLYDLDRQLNPCRPMIEVAVGLGCSDYLKLLLENGYQPGPTSYIGVLFDDFITIDTLKLLHSLGIKMTESVLNHMSSDRDIVQWLLSIGVNINGRSEHLRSLEYMIAGVWDPFTPLQRAGWCGNVSLIQDLIDYGANVNEPCHIEGWTALQAAARGGCFGAVQKLLELGADPNAPGGIPPRGRTAIESAAEKGRLDVVKLLLNSGVETSGCGRRQLVRSVGFAETEGHHAIVRILKSHAGWTEADENLLGQKDFIPVEPLYRVKVPAYVRRYYGDESDGEGPARSSAPEEDQPLDEVEPNTQAYPYGEFKSDSEGHASNSEEVSQAMAEESISRDVDTSETWPASDDSCCRVEELTEELDEPSETLLSTLTPISNFPDAYEALSEEVGLEFLPSTMSNQIREELEGDGCLGEPGGDLWAEEYSRFITELM